LKKREFWRAEHAETAQGRDQFKIAGINYANKLLFL
jgi:hypothetical protein